MPRTSRSLTSRTAEYLRKRGWIVGTVEHWQRYPGAKVARRTDLFGFIDQLALKGGRTLAIQSTSRANLYARVNKILTNENTGRVAQAWTIEVWGWHKPARLWVPVRARINGNGTGAMVLALEPESHPGEP